MVEETQVKQENKLVYHYTSLKVLYEIIKNKSLWLTSLSSTNDKKELEHGKNLFKDILATTSMGTDNDDFITALKVKSNFSKIDFYGVSFAKKGDSLTHWDRYAEQCTGISIAFNLIKIDTLFDNDYKAFIHSRIAYKKDAIFKSISPNIEIFKHLYNDRAKKDITKDMILNVFLNMALLFCTFYKCEDFIDEDEYRFVFTPSNWDLREKVIQSASKYNVEIVEKMRMAYSRLGLDAEAPKYAAFHDSIRSYYELKLGDPELWSSKLIPEIYLGPKCYQIKSELESFLKANGLEDTEVKLSEIELR